MNAVRDVREVDRERRERVAILQNGAPARDPLNNAFRVWHENAWTGQLPAPPAPPAGNRYYGGNAGNQAVYRGRDGNWHPTLPPSNLQARQRTRTPRGKGKGKDRVPGPDTRVYVQDGITEWEVVDYDDDEYWDWQNQQSQYRRNVEFQMERAE